MPQGGLKALEEKDPLDGKRVMGKPDLFRFPILFKHREIVHIAEAERIFLAQPQLAAEFGPNLPRIIIRPLFPVRNKENRIAALQPGQFQKLSFSFLGNKLIDRPFIAKEIGRAHV